MPDGAGALIVTADHTVEAVPLQLGGRDAASCYSLLEEGNELFESVLLVSRGGRDGGVDRGSGARGSGSFRYDRSGRSRCFRNGGARGCRRSGRGRVVSNLEGGNLLSCVLSNNHNDSLGVTGGQVGMNGSVNDEEIVGSVDPGVGVYDAGAVGTPVVSSHLRGSNPVVTGDQVVGDNRLGRGVCVQSHSSIDGAVSLGGDIHPPLDEARESLSVGIGGQPRFYVEDGVTTGCDAQLTSGGSSMCEEGPDSEDAILHEADSSLKESLLAITAFHRCPQVHPLRGLCHNTRSLLVEIQVGLNRVGRDVVELVGCVVY